jgi:hypothetical protein
MQRQRDAQKMLQALVDSAHSPTLTTGEDQTGDLSWGNRFSGWKGCDGSIPFASWGDHMLDTIRAKSSAT